MVYCIFEIIFYFLGVNIFVLRKCLDSLYFDVFLFDNCKNGV